MADNPPMTVAQLAKRWTVSPAHVYRMITERRIRVFRLGGKTIRIPYTEVLRCEQAIATATNASEDVNTATSSPGPRAVTAAVIGSVRG